MEASRWVPWSWQEKHTCHLLAYLPPHGDGLHVGTEWRLQLFTCSHGLVWWWASTWTIYNRRVSSCNDQRWTDWVWRPCKTCCERCYGGSISCCKGEIGYNKRGFKCPRNLHIVSLYLSYSLPMNDIGLTYYGCIHWTKNIGKTHGCKWWVHNNEDTSFNLPLWPFVHNYKRLKQNLSLVFCNMSQPRL